MSVPQIQDYLRYNLIGHKKPKKPIFFIEFGSSPWKGPTLTAVS